MNACFTCNFGMKYNTQTCNDMAFPEHGYINGKGHQRVVFKEYTHIFINLTP